MVGNSSSLQAGGATANTSSSLAPNADQPSFIVGVTGHMDLIDSEFALVEEIVRSFFRFLRHGNACRIGIEAGEQLRSTLASIENCGASTNPNVYEMFFRDWPGLRDTPIVVLSSLAPGADHLVARIAQESEFVELGFRLQFPLPFPLSIYRRSSAFIRTPKEGATQTEIDTFERENKCRLEKLSEIVNDSDDRCFPVGLAEDWSLNKDERNSKYLQELNDTKGRRRRYQAAGEYVATYSHILIAIWDHIDNARNDEGTAAIIRARRNGLTPSLLQTTGSLGLPVDGPTFHISTVRERRWKLENSSKSPTTTPLSWRTRWLFPYTKREQIAELFVDGRTTVDCDAAWQHNGLTQFIRETEMLNAFTARKAVTEENALKHRRAFLTGRDVGHYDAFQETQSENPLFKMFTKIADFRRRSADEQNKVEAPAAQRTLTILFAMTLLAAIFLDAFNHWHAQIEHEEHDHPAHVATPKQEPKPKTNETTRSESDIQENIDVTVLNSFHTGDPPELQEKAIDHVDDIGIPIGPTAHEELKTLAIRIRFAIGLLGFAMVGAAMIYFYRRRPRLHDEKAHELRAMAEGARVQMLWHLSGVGESVAANYMQRQRGELGWIRKAIRSVGMPYESARWAFDDIEPKLQIAIIKCVFHNWLRGHATNAQSNYFKSAKTKLVHRIHFWHKLGMVLVFAGLFLGLLRVFAAGLECIEIDFLTLASNFAKDNLLTRLLYFPLLFLILGLFIVAFKLQKWEDFRHTVLDFALDRMVPTSESNQFAHSKQKFHRQMFLNFATFCPLSSVVAGLTFLFAAELAHSSVLFPSIQNLVVILGSCLFVAGGLAVAWPERNLYSEIVYQYGTMQSLFELGANRVEPMIQDMEGFHLRSLDRSLAEQEANTFYQTLNEQDRQKFDKNAFIVAFHEDAKKAYLTKLREIQGAFSELGKEALDENAEWFLLHRSRPLEPVMAG